MYAALGCPSASHRAVYYKDGRGTAQKCTSQYAPYRFSPFCVTSTEQAETPVHQSSYDGRTANCTVRYILINRTWGVGIN